MAIIGAVGYWYQGDYQIPLIVMEELRKEGIEVLDLSMGAIKASTFLSEISPSKLILLASEKRGKRELRVYRPESEDAFSQWADLYNNMKAYYMDVDSLIKAGNALGSLPENTIVVECEVENGEGEVSEWGRQCIKLMKEEVYKLLGVKH
ncbi:hypothetical protein [Stygiolobus caldivivus]|uniref:Hydrogenase maturation protease n=1 Tax=Stygiolobus caldivivus TaxID=2824673 RepID=A0A8D5U3Y6_9CREN|nr:hypothetical protein [Stygiolobus caldivivus]BCU68824.1 hypothetical protein KN1_01210 [Stygiolobus caldivivus]